ncbi:hypothetical protein PLUTE_b6007 [Pseudoalteromonas luteoviolacea DSM 6061]|nr:hypothetical protein [Pseudoalteromonas luteoviolacea DSM 6061]
MNGAIGFLFIYISHVFKIFLKPNLPASLPSLGW